jgi:hypothetical protein
MNGIGLSKCDINHLPHNMLFHKSFNLNEVKIRSTTNCEKYYTKCITKKMVGWSYVGLKFSLHMVNIRHRYYGNHIIIGHAQHTLTKSSELISCI